MPHRHCSSCGRNLDRSSYSRNQWSKPVGVSRCHACVGGGGGDSSPSNLERESARRNDSNSASFPSYNLKNPFAEGGFRWVAKGNYTSGQRNGEDCVCKWFKTGHTFEDSFFALDIQATDKALDIIKEWNSRRYITGTVKLNIPQVWHFNDDAMGVIGLVEKCFKSHIFKTM